MYSTHFWIKLNLLILPRSGIGLKKNLLLSSVGLDAFWIIKQSWTPVRFPNCQVNTLSKTFTKIWVSATFAARFSEQSSKKLANCQSLSQPIYSILHYGNLTVVLSVDYTGTRRSFLIYILRTFTHTDSNFFPSIRKAGPVPKQSRKNFSSIALDFPFY